jgi:hypothetical protein
MFQFVAPQCLQEARRTSDLSALHDFLTKHDGRKKWGEVVTEAFQESHPPERRDACPGPHGRRISQ